MANGMIYVPVGGNSTTDNGISLYSSGTASGGWLSWNETGFTNFSAGTHLSDHCPARQRNFGNLLPFNGRRARGFLEPADCISRGNIYAQQEISGSGKRDRRRAANCKYFARSAAGFTYRAVLHPV